MEWSNALDYPIGQMVSRNSKNCGQNLFFRYLYGRRLNIGEHRYIQQEGHEWDNFEILNGIWIFMNGIT